MYTNYFNILHSVKKLEDHPWIKVYRHLNAKERSKIQANINFNNSKIPHLDKNYTQKLCYKSFLFLGKEEKISSLERCFGEAAGGLKKSLDKIEKSKNKLFSVLNFHNQSLKTTDNPALSIIITNIALNHFGYPPYLFYSFDDLYKYPDDFLHMSKEEFESYYFNSLFYGYRLIKSKVNTKAFRSKNMKILGEGAFTLIYYKNKQEAIKVPKNIAGVIISNPLEVYTLKKLEKFIPKNISRFIKYNKQDKSIVKNFIKGLNGEQTLEQQNNKLTPLQMHRLALLFRKLMLFIKETGLYLDISPPNFIWCKEKRDWFLVDSGPVPYELLKYFKTFSFSNYFFWGWLERRRQKKVRPIRSFDEGFFTWKKSYNY